MEENPYDSDDFARASERLRLALALLAQHQIAPSPLHFRIAYDCVAGRDAELSHAFQQTIEHADERTGPELWALYRRFYRQDDGTLDRIRGGLQQHLDAIRKAFQQFEEQLAAYADALEGFAGHLERDDGALEPVAGDVARLLASTTDVRQAHQQRLAILTGMIEVLEELGRELAQVKEASLMDALTGLPNRRAFDLALEDKIRAAREQQGTVSLLLADVDQFKGFNDSFGHLVGDKVLRFVSSTMKQCLKGRDFVARFGGEEFAAILPLTDLVGAEAVAEQIREAVSSRRLTNKQSNEIYGRVTLSIGIAQLRYNDQPQDVLHRVVQALALAKDRGRNRVERAA